MDYSSLTQEQCIEELRKRSSFIQFLSKEQLTPEVCLYAVECNGMNVAYLNAKQCAPKVCVAAVKQNLLAARYMASKMGNIKYKEVIDYITERRQDLKPILLKKEIEKLFPVMLKQVEIKI